MATISGHTVQLWAADGTPREVLYHDRRVGAVAIAPDGTWLATISGHTAQLWAADGRV